jgi:hypothetical protein
MPRATGALASRRTDGRPPSLSFRCCRASLPKSWRLTAAIAIAAVARVVNVASFLLISWKEGRGPRPCRCGRLVLGSALRPDRALGPDHAAPLSPDTTLPHWPSKAPVHRGNAEWFCPSVSTAFLRTNPARLRGLCSRTVNAPGRRDQSWAFLDPSSIRPLRRRRSRWSARSEARTNDLEVGGASVTLGHEDGPGAVACERH